MRAKILVLAVAIFVESSIAFGSDESVGGNGINSAITGLTGQGVAIGQVELGRPGSRLFDTLPQSLGLLHVEVRPKEVFARQPNNSSFDATPNEQSEVSSHAVEVAGIMISKNPVGIGVAPDGDLYSVGIIPDTQIVEDLYGQVASSANHIATLLPNMAMRAINMSIAITADGNDADGTSTLTSYLDWSAKQHDILYVVAGFETGGSGPLPSDNFNGMTIGFSEKLGSKYRKVDGGNIFTADDFGDRTFVDLIAPAQKGSKPKKVPGTVNCSIEKGR